MIYYILYLFIYFFLSLFTLIYLFNMFKNISFVLSSFHPGSFPRICYISFKNNALLGAQINLMATSMATSRAKAMAMAVAICRATWMEKTDGGKGNGNIGGKKHWQIRGGGKSTGGKFNGKIWVVSKSPWQHTRQRKRKLALRAKAIATQVAKLWQKLWQGLKTGRGSGKSRWHIAWPQDTSMQPLVCTSGFWNCVICKASEHFQSDCCGVEWSNLVLRNCCVYSSLGQQLPFGCVFV